MSQSTAGSGAAASSSTSSTSRLLLCATWPHFCAEPLSQKMTEFQTQQQQHDQQEESRTLSDIVVDTIERVELNPTFPSVGAPGSAPNCAGDFELDAAFMQVSVSQHRDERHGRRKENEENEENEIDNCCGAVFALRGYNGAVRIARQVGRACRHSILAGEGGAVFADAQCAGDEKIARLKMTTAAASDVAVAGEHEDQEQEQEEAQIDAPISSITKNNDTVGVVGLLLSGDQQHQQQLVAAVSTSGISNKAVGRVGDSALFGSGLFAEAGVGACVATGDGDAIALFPICFQAVQHMKKKKTKNQGDHDQSNGDFISATDACKMALDEFAANAAVKDFLRRRTRGGQKSGSAPTVLVALAAASCASMTTGGACCDDWASGRFDPNVFAFVDADSRRPRDDAVRITSCAKE